MFFSKLSPGVSTLILACFPLAEASRKFFLLKKRELNCRKNLCELHLVCMERTALAQTCVVPDSANEKKITKIV